MSAPSNQARVRAPRIAEDAVGRARLAVVPRIRSRAPRMPFAILVGLVLLGGVAGLLLFNTHMQKGSFALTAMQLRADGLDAREQQLQMEVDRLRDPQALALRAARLGMVPMATPVFLDLGTARVYGDPTPATPAAAMPTGQPRTPKPAVLRPPPVEFVPTGRHAGDTGSGAAATKPGSGTGTKNGH
jgi:hypothetical protein